MRSIITILVLAFISNISLAQSSHFNMGQKALIDGNFKSAVSSLEKAAAESPNDIKTLQMLGYSYYHSGNYDKAVSTYNKVISLRPEDNSSYYYRGKARVYMATETEGMANIDREKLLLASIRDFSKGIEMDSEDVKQYQNRAVAYREYGILKGQKIPKFYDKAKAVSSLKSSIADFEKVLALSPANVGIRTQLSEVKTYLKNFQ